MIEYGCIVMAKSGHDKGSCFVVVGQESEQYVYIANGKQRPLENPKLKNVKHIEVIQNAQKFKAQGDPTNKQIRRFLSAYNQPLMGGLING
jgi:ribosomal protein L14E/L6E/L27E